MRAATWPRARTDERLMVVERRAGRITDGHVGDLPSWLRAGDLLVVNDAATLPASLAGRFAGLPVELRLVGAPLDSAGDWRAVVFGAGDWRTPTEQRPAPPRLEQGDAILFGAALHARVVDVAPESPRLVTVRFSLTGDALWQALYRVGAPVQYSYTRSQLALWHVQTGYAARPWAAEQPSAGRPLDQALLSSLARAGIELTAITHAAGLSSTGDAALDALLPLAERYEVGAEAARAVNRARAAGRRVVAVGTSVVRALESAARHDVDRLSPASGMTTLRLGPDTALRVTDALFTGMHEPGTSHFALLQAFASAALLDRSVAHGEAAGYVTHEFGDSLLLI